MSDPLSFDRRPPVDDPDDPTVQPVIVKVRRPGYVPKGFHVRTRVDELLYTADTTEVDLQAATRDPQVESVERARPLHPA